MASKTIAYSYSIDKDMAKQLTVKLNIETWKKTNKGLVKKVLEKEMHLSRKEISRLKFDGQILVNGKRVYTDYHMNEDDELVVIFPEDQDQVHVVTSQKPVILHEEEDFVIVNKPSGIPTHASHNHISDSMGTVLQAYYQSQGKKFIVRAIGRLDLEVSGALIFAKNKPAAARLSKQRDNGVLTKVYTGIVSGFFDEAEGDIDLPVMKEDGNMQRVMSLDGKDAFTHYKVIRQVKIHDLECSVLELSISTGRTHQIRTHMQAIGHPLLGDALYEGDTTYIKRPALHCTQIDMKSPFSRHEIHVVAPFPQDMADLLDHAIDVEHEFSKTIRIASPKPADNTVSDLSKLVADVENAVKYEVDEDEIYEPAVQEEKKKSSNKPFIIILIFLLLCGIGIALWNFIFKDYFLTEKTTQEEAYQETYDSLTVLFTDKNTVEYGMDFEFMDYIKENHGTIVQISAIDTKIVGTHLFQVWLSTENQYEEVRREYQTDIEVIDTQLPIITIAESEITCDEDLLIYNISVKDPVDGTIQYQATLQRNSYTYDVKQQDGSNTKYDVTVKAMDQNGNQAEAMFVWVSPKQNEPTSTPVATSTPVPTATPTPTPTVTPTPTATPTEEPTPTPDTTDQVAPVITLKDEKIEIYTGDTYALTYNVVSVSDDTDGNLEWADVLQNKSWTIRGSVDNQTIADYTITVLAMDSSGNQTEKAFVISVVAAPTPVPTIVTVADSADAYGQIYNFLTGTMGFSKAQACGILANMHRESRFNPTSENSLGYYGLCQWGGGRRESLVNWCTSNGYDPATIDGQLHFLQYEFPRFYPNTYAQFTACENTEEGAREAARIFALGYEVAGEYYANMSLDKAAEYFNR